MPTRTILITGASSGIGAALSRAYADSGVRLVLWGRNAERLDMTAAQCRARGAAVETESFDLRDIEGLMSRLDALDGRHHIDLAIFNAGLGGSVPAERLAEDAQAARATAEVNFTVPVVAASAMAERMAERQSGHIVLVGSIAGSFPLPMAPSYAGTKAGLAMFAEALALRMNKHRVAVSLVEPGFIDTPMSEGLEQPKPFLMAADDAAAIIKRKIDRRAARIVVPWQFAVLRRASQLLPRAVTRAILRRV